MFILNVLQKYGKYVSLWVLVLFLTFSGMEMYGQRFQLKEKTKKNGDIIEKYHVLRKHKKIKHGLYIKYLKDRIIVCGYYDNNEKTGIWRYFDGLMRVQLEYDYDKQKVISFLSFQDTTHYAQPPLLLGSTMELKYRLKKLIKYPKDAWLAGYAGEVVVGLKIDTAGHIYDYTIEKSCYESLDREALRVVKEVVDDYRWLAAIKDDKFVNSTYLIPIRFEMHGRRFRDRG